MLTTPLPYRPDGTRTAAPAGASSGEPPDTVPQANSSGTIAAVTILAVTGLLLNGRAPSELGRFAAYGFALALGVTLVMDARAGLQNLIRADVLALVSFYFLTFFEFLFPQSHFDELITSLESARGGIDATLLGAAGLMIGRHLWHPKQRPLQRLMTKPMPPAMLLGVFWGSFVLGYIHMLIAVDFDVVKMIGYFTDARFSQPWQRGRLGDWKALLVELGMFIYLIPPLAGVILARRSRYGLLNLALVTFGLLFTLFYGFTSGTRNVLASYLVTLLIGYAFAIGPAKRRETVVVGVVCAAAMLIATPMMLSFRTIGFKWWIQKKEAPAPTESGQTVFVDYNLFAICKIMDVFPARKDYLGLEIPYNALIRPIPRALWPGKPEGLTYTIEDALGVEGLTISATFVGEGYMAFGLIGVFVTGLVFGALFGWWNHLASPRNSELGILIYASGFFCAVISMRSLFAFTVALLPTGAAILIATVLVRQVIALEKRITARLRDVKVRQQLPPRRGPLPPRGARGRLAQPRPPQR